MPATRAAATRLEKGDESILEQLADEHVVAWIPEDTNATSWCRASLLRRVATGPKPAFLKLIAPLPLFPGACNVEAILDNFWSPLLGELWAPLVRRCEFSDFSMERVLPGPSTPRHVKMGLAVFTIAFSEERAPPTMLHFRPPLLQAEAAAAPITFDMRADDAMSFSLLMRQPLMAETIWRNPPRSPAAASEVPRVCIDVLFPASNVDLDREIVRQVLRRLLPSSTFFGTQALYSAADAMTLEVNRILALAQYWPLCTHLLAASSSGALLLSGASGDTWASTMDRVLLNDPCAAATLLRWKPSRGGRKVATPSATTTAATALRKKAHKPPASMDHLVEVILNGEPGREDGEVGRLLMNHLATTTGLGLTGKGADRTLQHGEFERASRRSSMTALVAREVAQVHAAFHGQVIAVGQMKVGIEVLNERFDMTTETGNGARRLPCTTAIVFGPDSANSASQRAAFFPGMWMEQAAAMEFLCDFRVGKWNAQALFAVDAGRRSQKMQYLQHLMKQLDVLLVTEAHGAAGDRALWHAPVGCSAWPRSDFHRIFAPFQIALSGARIASAACTSLGRGQRLRGHPDDQGIQQLAHLTTAMRQVGLDLEREWSGRPVAEYLEDWLGATLRFIRAFERGLAGGISNCLRRCPRIRDLVANPCDFVRNATAELQQVRARSVELARGRALGEPGRSHADLRGSSELQAARARTRNARLIFRLRPGHFETAHSIMDRNGEQRTAPGDMAEALQ
ncbi:unnamed protein product [Prorocentrum cordatum]|uniref:Uncharacterized protein n=1 Tax=Prorocentrum cordatum TaxID=2364126 RepID=A0ABN9X6E4_9DINO|nr:unnamed protein product [Polarella glacialis]